MKRLALSVIFIFLLLSVRYAIASDSSFNRVNVAVTLSGHIFVGVGFEHGFNRHHAVQATLFPVALPGKGFPFAFSAGYNYHFGQNKWRGKIGSAMAILISPPDADKRKTLPMLLLTPGVQYTFTHKQTMLFQPWLAFFLKKVNRRFAPIGLEFKYGYDL